MELLPRLLSYVRHLPAYKWEPVILNGPPPPDVITYTLFAGLLEIGDKNPEFYEKITRVLWGYAESIVPLMSENGI